MHNRQVSFPRILMLDSSPLGETSATGQLKTVFLGDWPVQNFLQVWERSDGFTPPSLHFLRMGETRKESQQANRTNEQLLSVCRQFSPDVIYFRLVASPLMIAFAEKVIDILGKPVVTHVMDDWPESLREDDPDGFVLMDAAVRRAFARSVNRLSICDAMSTEYRTRYGYDFIPLANGVDISEYPEKPWSERPPVSSENPFTFRYIGGLADDMTYSSVCGIANLVSRMQLTRPIRFEIYTMNWFRQKAEAKLGGLPGVHIFGSVEGTDAYRHLLQDADALVIAYNFDDDSIRHVRLSMANKMPECLASGTPLLAFGPQEVATIDYLSRTDCAVIVTVDEEHALQQAVSSLVDDQAYCREIANRARDFVAHRHSKYRVQKDFLQVVRDTAEKQTRPPQTPLVFPYDRTRKAHLDETMVVARLIAEQAPNNSTMIDVGAHFGTALKPFLDKGWRILAFEPDENNRAQLLQMLEGHPYKENVSVDIRALSNVHEENAVFYRSNESTGISGLSAFHETHKAGNTVDITTLTNVLESRQLEDIQFLKIDTEGYDLNVLRGFPWDSIKPAIIECEFEDSKTVPLGYTYHDLATYLVELGYTVYVSEWHPIIRYGIRHDWHLFNRYPCELSDSKAWGNLIAFRDTIDEIELLSAIHEELDFGQPLVSPGQKGSGKFNLISHGNVLQKDEAYQLSSPGNERYLACVFPQAVDAGEALSATIDLHVSGSCKLNVMLCRNGYEAFESSSKELELTNGSHSIEVNHLFKQAHDSVRIQIGSNDNTVWVSNLVPGLVSPETGRQDEECSNEPVVSPEPKFRKTQFTAKRNRQRSSSLRLSLVTPSLNQSKYLSSMLESVEGQTIQAFEHLIYDAGSTDGSIEKFENYEKTNPYARLHVGRDSSQTNAINLGFTECRGDIIAWLNTDDRYVSPVVFERVLKFFGSHPEVDVVYGRGNFVDTEGNLLRDAYIHSDATQLEDKFTHSVGILQPSLFMRRAVFDSVGPLNEDLHYCMDYEYWIRVAQTGHDFSFIDEVFSEAILHSESKTGGQRAAQLLETAQVCQSQYGFVSIEWIKHLADMELAGADGILVQSDRDSPEQVRKVESYFLQFNADQKALAAIWSRSNYPVTQKTLEYALEHGLGRDTYVVTAFNSKFFHEGLTLIAELHKQTKPPPAILVYDLGLTIDERSILAGLKDVCVLTFPHESNVYFDGYFTARTYGFKSYIVWRIGELVAKGTTILWIDAGIAPVHDIKPIIEIIHREDIFLVNHDDVWDKHQFWNITFATDACIKVMDASNAELVAPHIRAGILGYKVGGKFHQLFRDAYGYSLESDAICGEKHPVDQRVTPADFAANEMMISALNDVEYCSHLPRKEMRRLFGYFGHRHDQSIVSILAARYSAPVQSAKRYCLRYKDSSELSKVNWNTSFMEANGVFEYQIDSEYLSDGAICIQHRGLYKNHQGLRFQGLRKPRAIIMGNGPSIKGFDFHRLKDFDVFGMNAAYRYWDKINWYPQYYSCLDIVVGLSHAKEIKRLIEKADQYGIRLFLLRENLIEQLGHLRNQDRVINFDRLKLGSEVLSAPTITTGSHTTAWAAYLGYQQGFLLGIDCDYVEIIEGAIAGKGTELIMESVPDSNPNYFFDDYQQVGDKYNIPNPDRDIHQESWREIAEHMQKTGISMRNANMLSKVDAFDFCDIEELVEAGKVNTFSRESIFLHNFILSNNLAGESETGLMVVLDSHFPASLQLFVESGFEVHCYNKNTHELKELSKRFGRDPRVIINESPPQSRGTDEAHVDGSIIRVLDPNVLEGVDFLQINRCESGLEILQGMPWDRNKPAVIECRFSDMDAYALDVVHVLAVFLVDMGYAVYLNQWQPESWHSTKAKAHRLLRYPCELEDAPTKVNILAFRDPVSEEALYRAMGKLELNSIKRLKLKGLQFNALSMTGNVPRDGDSFLLIPSSVQNNMKFAYICMVTPEEKLCADVSFYAHADCKLSIALCRDGSTPYESESRLLEFSAGHHKLTIEHVFEGAHRGVRVQIGAEQEEVKLSEIRIELQKGPYSAITESLMDHSQSPLIENKINLPVEIVPAEFNLHTANQLFLEENYEKAIVIYLHLGKLRPFGFYSDNALMCARKMGLEENITINELELQFN